MELEIHTISIELDELCENFEQHLLKACRKDLSTLSIQVDPATERGNILKMVCSLIGSNEFPSISGGYRQWTEDMATSLAENLSGSTDAGSISDSYSMVSPGWEELKCAFQLGYELREHDRYLKHMKDLCELTIQQSLSAFVRSLLHAYLNSLDDVVEESLTEDVLEIIENRIESESLVANPETWLFDSRGEPLWKISATAREQELIVIENFLQDIIKSTYHAEKMVNCAVVINYLSCLPQEPTYHFEFTIMHHVNREYIYAECIGSDEGLELNLNNNGNTTTCGRFDQDGHHPGFNSATEWVESAQELLNLDARITCETDLDSITWYEDESQEYWRRLEALEQ